MIQRIVKMDAAARLLDAAIRLWFEEGDPTAIYTLEGAAFGIFAGYAKTKGIKLSGLFRREGVDPKLADQLWKHVGKIRGFFKHGNEDPDGVLEFETDHVGLFLFNTVDQYHELTRNMTFPMRAFTLYMRMHHAGEINSPPVDGIAVESLKEIGRGDFLKRFESV